MYGHLNVQHIYGKKVGACTIIISRAVQAKGVQGKSKPISENSCLNVKCLKKNCLKLKLCLESKT